MSSAPVGKTFPYIGAAAGYRAVLVSDAVPTLAGSPPHVLYLAPDHVVIEDAANVPPPTTGHTLAVTWDGVTEFTRTF